MAQEKVIYAARHTFTEIRIAAKKALNGQALNRKDRKALEWLIQQLESDD